VEEAVRLGRGRGAAVVANAKPRSFGRYAGASLVSLNRPEATEALGLPDLLDPEEAPDAAARLAERGGIDAVLVTLGDQGMAAADRVQRVRVPAQRPEVFDATGAGDTTIATVALGIAAAGFRREVFELAAHTAAAVVAHAGVAVPSEEDLRRIADIIP
jgi:D-beta-D-heptose 7-phosphate kinase/D-beta-D-heptose 1-phosphate adenosyltransferase